MISIGILFLLLIFSTFQSKTSITFCNTEDKINILLKVNDFNVLINPVGEKQVLECLGKTMVFYERTIDIVMTNNSPLLDTLRKRYTISKVIPSTSLKIDNFYIRSDSKVHISTATTEINVHQKIENFLKGDTNTNSISVYPYSQIIEDNKDIFRTVDLILHKDQLVIYSL